MWKKPVPVLAIALLAAVPLQAADFTVTNLGTTAYVINGTNNPTLTLTRGVTYTFQVNASGHPLWIKTSQSTGTGGAFNTGVLNNGVQVGTLTFTVPAGAPSTLFYNCQFHGTMTGRINIVAPTSVEAETWGGAKDLFR